MIAVPVIETVVAALTVSEELPFNVNDDITYVPPVSASVAPALTITVPYAPALRVFVPVLTVTEVVPAVAAGATGAVGIAGKGETVPYVELPFVAR